MPSLVSTCETGRVSPASSDRTRRRRSSTAWASSSSAGRKGRDSVSRDQFAAAAPARRAVRGARRAAHPLQHRLRLLRAPGRTTGSGRARSSRPVRPIEAARRGDAGAGPDAPHVDHRPRARAKNRPRRMVSGAARNDQGIPPGHLHRAHDERDGASDRALLATEQRPARRLARRQPAHQQVRPAGRVCAKAGPDRRRDRRRTTSSSATAACSADACSAATGYQPPTWDEMLAELAAEARQTS